MSIDKRELPRFRDFAGARIDGVSHLPGFLEDVSKTGCRVRFSDNFILDSDAEYDLTILPSLRSGLKSFTMVVKPEWVVSEKTNLEVGFSVLHCPGVRQYQKYVECLADQCNAEVQEA